MIRQFLRRLFGRKPTDVLDWGADPTGRRDSTWSIQQAINDGTGNFPVGVYVVNETVTVRPSFDYAGPGKLKP